MLIAIAALTVILDAIFIVHMMKTGRPGWWGYIILSFPVIGCVVYYCIEIFPDTPEARKAEKLVKKVGQRGRADKAFMKHVHEVEICGSIDNKIALARECMERDLFDDAARIYHTCLQGAYAEDPHLLLGLAEAQVAQPNFSEARATLARLRAKDAAFRPNEVALLNARTIEGLGDTPGALQVYERLIPVYAGLEARYRHGLLLQKLERAEEARNAFAAMNEHAQRHRLTHEQEQAWLNLAKQELNRK